VGRARKAAAPHDALLDQGVLAGVGNIYRAEALFVAGIHPLRPSGSLTAQEWDSLWRTVRKLMRRGVVQKEIRTVAAAESAHPGSDRGADDAFYVYQQEVCRRCSAPISEFPLSARRMFACPSCQPRRRAKKR
jgi:endonuclease-8